MTVNTKKVAGRREVRYESYADFLADAERHSNGNVRSLGNWSPGQIYEHMARALDLSIDGADFAMPAPVRWMMKLMMKKKMLNKAIPSGFKSPEKYVPGDTASDAGLASLRTAIERQKTESKRAMHPAFGNITRAEWDLFHLRHAEMHMSFLVVE